MNGILDSRLRILLVEDNEGDAVLVEEYVNEAGTGQFVLRRAKTMAEGQQLLAEYMPQVILLDLNLPDSKGLDTLERFCMLDGGADRPRPPIIVLTSLDDQEMADRAIKGCAQDYLIKNDVNARVLLRSIRFAIQRHGKSEMDKIQKNPETIGENQHEALAVLQRVNRTAPGEVGSANVERAVDIKHDSSLLLEHYTTGSRATELVLTGLNGRIHKLELDQHDYAVNEARRETLWLQLERLLLGNGRGPLAARLETLEKTLLASAEEQRERRSNRVQWLIAIGILAAGWIASLIVWVVTSLFHVG
jgi:DNA-binding response OmpR family regulator